jgi:predicted aminopeptidase
MRTATSSSTSNRAPVRRRRRRARLALALLLGVALLGVTPTGCYLSRAGYEQGRILARRKPIARLVERGGVDAPTRDKLRLVLDARRFAVDSLGLDAGRSFTRFTDIGRDTLVLVLSAAHQDRLEAYTWWFPIVGRVPYKGYFDFGAARRAARGLRARGFDVYLRPSSAYSTLGWFEDPLLNTTLQEDSVDLANTVVHELTHNTFYAPGQAVFNESFASFVGSYGSARYFDARGDSASAQRARARWTDDAVLATFWQALATHVDSAYAAHPGRTSADSAARVAARDTVYAHARRLLADSVGPRLSGLGPTRAAAWAARVQLDNASLLARRTYARELGLFEGVLAREGGDMRRAIARVVALAKATPKAPYDAVRAWVAAPPSAATP